MRRVAQVVVTAVAATCAVGMTGAPAGAQPKSQAAAASAASSKVKVIATGLNGPRQLNETRWSFLVAESDTGQITKIDKWSGAKKVVVSGLGSNGVQGVVKIGDRYLIATGGANDAPTSTGAGPAVLIAKQGGKAKVFADLLAYEKKHNPDGQTQGTGPDDDTLSNPYYIVADRSGKGAALVADAGANDILRIGYNGRVSTFAVLPVVTSGACATVPNNTASGFGCDPVPTGIAYGPHGDIYVSALTSEVPGQGRIYVMNRRGHITRVIKGLDAPTGVAVGRHGDVYASEVTYGAPEGDGPPPADFDPSTVGRIVKIDRCGHKTYAQVTMPSGLLYTGGDLYASAWSIAGFLGIQNAGQVVKVGRSAFVPAS